MNTRNQQKPLLIGLPGSGKTVTTSLLSEYLGLEFISTDSLFRDLRSIPFGSNTVWGHEVVAQFLGAASQRMEPSSFKKLKSAASTIQAKTGLSQLSCGTLFRSFGEDVFRAFEIEMNKWLNDVGYFQDRLVDISGSAPLYKENREIFAVNFNIVLLDVSTELLIRRLTKDYRRHREKGTVIRGRYEDLVENALRHSPSDKHSSIIVETISKIVHQDRAERLCCYREWAQTVITLNDDIPPDRVMHIVLNSI